MTDEHSTSDSGSSSLDLERLEAQLRALPAPPVPESLSTKLLAGIPSAAAKGSAAAVAVKSWTHLAIIGAASLLVVALIVVLLPQEKAANDQNRGAKSNANEQQGPGTISSQSSKALAHWEEAVRFDPFNADAWFSLAKAQAEAHQTAEAVASARKALDIARAGNRSVLVRTLEAWISENRPKQSAQ